MRRAAQIAAVLLVVGEATRAPTSPVPVAQPDTAPAGVLTFSDHHAVSRLGPPR
jgi:hypothetical protein